jgi:hypothetical protein
MASANITVGNNGKDFKSNKAPYEASFCFLQWSDK